MLDLYNNYNSSARKEYLFYLLFFLPLIAGPAIAYVFIVISIVLFIINNKNFTIFGFMFAICLLFVLMYKFLQIGDIGKWQDMSKFYLGWPLIYAYLYYSRTKISIDKLIILFAIEVIVEGILINTIIPSSTLRNYPHDNELDYNQIFIGEFFHRVYSTGTNASVSATIMCMLLSIRESLRKNGILNKNLLSEVLALISIILFNSGTGYMLYAFYLLYRANVLRLKNWPVIAIVAFLAVLALDYFSNSDDAYSVHFSWEYVSFLFDYKADMYKDYLSLFDNWEVYLFGIDFAHYPSITWGDTAFIEFFVSFGIIGYSLLFGMVLPKINKYNWYPLLIGLIGIWHYGGIFSLPGQMVFSYALLINSDFMEQIAPQE